MTELRKRMIECLQLRGVSERTQEAYVRAIRHLAEHYHRFPRSAPLAHLPEPASSLHPLRQFEHRHDRR